jgi:hypothetical protein
MTQRQIREVWNVTKFAAVALAVLGAAIVVSIEIGGFFGLRGLEPVNEVHGAAGNGVAAPAETGAASAVPYLPSQYVNQARDPEPQPETF